MSRKQTEQFMIDRQKAMQRLEKIGNQAVMVYLNEQAAEKNKNEMNMVIRYYHVRHLRVSDRKQNMEVQNNLFIRAFQAEYEFVQNNRVASIISADAAQRLREQITFDEMIYMQNSSI